MRGGGVIGDWLVTLALAIDFVGQPTDHLDSASMLSFASNVAKDAASAAVR